MQLFALRSLVGWQMAALALYPVAGFLGLAWRVEDAGSSPLWPAAGVAVAILARYGARGIPWLVAGCLIYHACTYPRPWPEFLLLTLGNVGGPLLVLAAVRSRAWMGFAGLADVGWFGLIAVLTGVINATWGTLCVSTFFDLSLDASLHGWWIWALGDAVGVLCCAPALLTLRWPPHRCCLEGVVLALVLAGTLLSLRWAPPGIGMAAVFLTLPPLLWAAVRFSVGATALAMLATAAAIGSFTVLDQGPFQGTGILRMLLVQSCLVGLCLTALLLAAAQRSQRLAWTRLAESEALYRTLFAGAGDGVLLLEAGRVVESNPAAAQICGRTDLAGVGLDSLMDPPPSPGASTAAGRIRRPDGSQVAVEAGFAEVDLAAGRRQVVILRDVTERQRLEAELRQGQKLETVGQLAGGIAHDFNNMLTGIIGSADLLAMQVQDPRALRLVRGIVHSGDRAAALVRKLLNFARKGGSPSTPIHLGAIVADAVALVAPSLGRRIQVRCDLPGDPLTVVGDAAMLQNAVINLAVNARDAMPDGGTLSLRLERVELGGDEVAGLGAGGYARLTVQDTGQGMTPEVLRRIGEPFFTTKAEGKGTGLGVAGIKRTLADHHGAMTVASVAGRGTTCTLWLPLSGGASQVVQPDQVPERGQGTVLVVDDDEIVRGIAVHLVRSLGYETMEACDGREALERVRAAADRIDILIIDTEMPVLRGPECIAAVHQIAPWTRSILTSGFNQERLSHELRESGAVGFLHKPYRLVDMSRLLAEAMRQRRAATT